MTTPRVVILYLGRRTASGEWRRVVTWRGLLEDAGAEVIATPLLEQHRSLLRPEIRDVPRACAGSIVPEALTWSPRSVLNTLDKVRPQVIVAITARAFHPSLIGMADVTVLDFVDSLARSYSDRGGLSLGWRSLAYRILSRRHRRFESRCFPSVVRVASGWRDAQDLRAEWVPGHLPAPRRESDYIPTNDVLFFGNLAYPPNVAAVRRLARVWPEVQRRRPGTTAVVAGSAPVPEVRRIVGEHGWELIADFDDLQDVCDRCRLAVAPLDHTAGIQTKVLEAAAMGMAQVVTPPAMEGMAPGFPVTVAPDDAALVHEICRLLDHPADRVAEATAAQHHVQARYSRQCWTNWASHLLKTAAAPFTGSIEIGPSTWSDPQCLPTR